MVKPEQENPVQLNIQETNTEKSNIDLLNTYQSIYPAKREKTNGASKMDTDRMDKMTIYQEIIKENIEYPYLAERYGQERTDEVVDLMLETVLSQRPYIRIAGDDYPVSYTHLTLPTN